MKFVLPKLDYSYSSLEPHIDATTMEIHHSKHHGAYVDNLNKALEGLTQFEDMSIEELLSQIDEVPQNVRQAVINNGGGHLNHSLFWKILSPNGGGEPEGKLMEAINSSFESFDKFKEDFTQKAMTLFGSGWVFMTCDNDGKLSLKRQSFQNNPIMSGQTPILGLDVWEHAYYLKYQNRRKEYIDAWWNIVNWDEVSVRFEKLTLIS